MLQFNQFKFIHNADTYNQQSLYDKVNLLNLDALTWLLDNIVILHLIHGLLKWIQKKKKLEQ